MIKIHFGFIVLIYWNVRELLPQSIYVLDLHD